ncbi:MAG: GNAT family N-acetyltransferase [Thiolinea sp.]
MMDKIFEIKTASRAEIDIAVDWAAGEGWNPGLYDAECYYAADPESFLLGYLDDKPIASISAVKYGQTFGFIGFYIVAEAYRGQGYGIQIWNAAMARLKGRNIGLDGVIAQQDNYRKSGFTLAYSNIRYEGVTGQTFSGHEQLIGLSELTPDQIYAYDHPFFPDDRRILIQSWVSQPESQAIGFLDGDKLTGYGVIRRCRSGYKIGPLFADNAEIAETLFMALQAKVTAGEAFFLDVPAVNTAAVALAEHHNMHPAFETARMYTGTAPDIQLKRTFGVTSFEVG